MAGMKVIAEQRPCETDIFAGVVVGIQGRNQLGRELVNGRCRKLVYPSRVELISPIACEARIGLATDIGLNHTSEGSMERR